MIVDSSTCCLLASSKTRAAVVQLAAVQECAGHVVMLTHLRACNAVANTAAFTPDYEGLSKAELLRWPSEGFNSRETARNTRL